MLADRLVLDFGRNIELFSMKGKDAHQQLLATLEKANGGLQDLTRDVEWNSQPSGVVAIDKSGRITPLTDGGAVVTARAKSGETASIRVEVTEASRPVPIHFANQIVPVFTKYGCNGGGCHGKAAGQNGFRLSLLGFEPQEDYDHLVKEARGRRLFPAAPERSLLLTKAVASLPHGGGKRMESDSDDYRLLVRWISQGMPVGNPKAPTVSRISVYPSERILSLNGEQQLVVTAHYSDGSVEDVTRSALYEPNDKDMAKCDDRGVFRAYNQPGEVAVMVRYQSKVSVFRATIPLGAPVEHLPPAKNFVDELVFKQLKKVGMPPSEVCDDATFLRRVTVDVAGRLPTPEELRDFLSDIKLDKRDRAVDRLVNSGDYADYFANKWSALLRNKRTESKQARGSVAFHGWIRDSLAKDRPFNEFVREIVAATGDIEENPPVAWYRQVSALQSQLEDTAQLFLGQRLQCAQCHHHPYEKWSQNDYWSFGAFFAQVGRKSGRQPGEEEIYHRRGLARATNKKTGLPVTPAGLGEPAPSLDVDDDPRQALADWITAPKNPFFAKALVNRYWKHFFGRGLVDPEDDMRETNPPTNPELLEALAQDFIQSGYSLKEVISVIARSSTYQLSSVPNEFNVKDRHHFARYYPRRLPAEVLLDAVDRVTGGETHFEGLPAGTRAIALPDNSFNASSYFLTVFGRPESSSACECERSMDASLSQSLHLLNSKDIQAKVSADWGRAAQLAREKERTDSAKLGELYEMAIGRRPKAEEIKLAEDYFAKKTTAQKDDEARKKAKREAYEDTVWALLNTKEFLFNH